MIFAEHDSRSYYPESIRYYIKNSAEDISHSILIYGILCTPEHIRYLRNLRSLKRERNRKCRKPVVKDLKFRNSVYLIYPVRNLFEN